MATTLPTQTNTPPQQGTGFTNLSSYLNANQNNQLGSTIAGNIEQAGTNATNALGAANNTFQTGVNAEQNRQAALGQGVSTTLGNVAGGNYTVQPSDVTTFQNALSGQSQGPTGLNNAGTLAQNAQQAQQLGQSTATQAGQYGLLQNYIGQGQQYGLGQQTLDAAILGNTGASQLGQARAATANLGGQATQDINQATAQGTGLQNSAQQLASNTQNQLGSAVQNYQQMLSGNLANAEAQTNAAVAALGGTGSNSAINLSPTELQQLNQASGGALAQGTNLYNTDLSNYVTANQQYANTQDIQTAQNLAQAQALQQLAGTNGLTGNNAALLNSYTANPSAVGSYLSNNPFSVANAGALSQAIQANANNYNTAIAPINANISNAQNNMNNISQTYALQQAANQGLGANNPYAAALSSYTYNPAANGGAGTAAQQASVNAGVSTAPLLGSVYATNNANLANYNNQLAQQGQQFDINRILGITPAASSVPSTGIGATANPILGNGGQPLTLS